MRDVSQSTGSYNNHLTRPHIYQSFGFPSGRVGSNYTGSASISTSSSGSGSDAALIGAIVTIVVVIVVVVIVTVCCCKRK